MEVVFFDKEDKEVEEIFIKLEEVVEEEVFTEEGEVDEEVGRGGRQHRQGGSGHLHRVGQHPLCGVH